MKIIDLDNWARKDAYKFFKDYGNPHFNVCTRIEISKTYQYFETQKISKFRGMLYLICVAANSVDEIRTRVREDNVIVKHESVHPSFTWLNEDKSLTFCNATYVENCAQFFKNVDTSISEVSVDPADADKEILDDVLFVSCIPWIDFTSISHPMRMNNTSDSIPRISWGKFTKECDRWLMPISLQLHHGLADGYHAGLFFEKLEELLNRPKAINWPH